MGLGVLSVDDDGQAIALFITCPLCVWVGFAVFVECSPKKGPDAKRGSRKLKGPEMFLLGVFLCL